MEDLIDNRIIIVTGPARSGTSIMAYTLTTNPNTKIFVDGGETHVLENEIVPMLYDPSSLKRLKRVLNKVGQKYLILKRPNAHYQEIIIPDAFYIVMTRAEKELKKSLSSSSMTGWLKNKTMIQEYYELATKNIDSFIEQDPLRRLKVSLEKFRKNPNNEISRIQKMISIPGIFNTLHVQQNKHWDHSWYIKDLHRKGRVITDLSSTKRSRTQNGLRMSFSNREISCIPSI